MKQRLLPIAAVATLGLVTAACGDDSDTSSTTAAPATAAPSMAPVTTAPEPTMAPATTPPGEMVEMGDIVDVAVGAGDFSTLVAAVQAAGLEDTLRGEGPFTVFAPTDAAFAALPEGTVEALLADLAGDLTSILTYHVVAGEVLSSDVVGLDGQSVATVNGAEFTVNVGDDGSVSLTDGTGAEVNVIAVDVPASNGVIHVIDAVLMPPAE